LSVDDAPVGVTFVPGGYLFLASPQGMSILEQNHVVQKSRGADVAMLSPEALKARFPWLNTDGVAGGSLGLSGEGWLDPHSLLMACPSFSTPAEL
jgi:glycine/D-amino acid oxidase-like deaminating enzyme